MDNQEFPFPSIEVPAAVAKANNVRDVVELYVELTEGSTHPLYAALRVKEVTGVSIAQLYDALMEAGLFKS